MYFIFYRLTYSSNAAFSMEEVSSQGIVDEIEDIIDVDVKGRRFSDIIDILSKLSRQQRIELCHTKSERKNAQKQTIFFRMLSKCWKKGGLDVARYFIEHCEADLEEKCLYTVKDDNDSTHEVPPLWLASITSQVEIAELLLDHGADVNGRSDSNSTALRAACYRCDISMVKLLVSRGADINIPNRYGCTCLMNSIESTEIAEYLIEKGAEINAKETGKLQLTAAHYAIHNGNEDALKAIVEAGADLSIPDKDGNVPLISAALLSQPSMVEYLKSKEGSSQEKIMKAYELLASAEFDEGKISGIDFLKKAIDIKEQLSLPQSTDRADELQPFLHFTSAPTTIKEVNDMSKDTRTLHAVSVLIKSRYFDFLHYEFLYSFLQYAAAQHEDGLYDESFKTFSFAHGKFMEKKKWLHDNALYAVSMAVLSYLHICIINSESSKVSVSDVCELFHSLVRQLQECIREGKIKKHKENTWNFQYLLGTALYIVKIGLTQNTTSPMFERFAYDVRCLNAMRPRFQDGDTVLHAVVDESLFLKIDYIRKKKYSPCLDKTVISFLLSKGADPNSQNNMGETPLYSLIKPFPSETLIEEFDDMHELVMCLLRHDAHVDVRNKDNTSCLQKIHFAGVKVPEVNFMTLKCLAANVVCMYNIPYNDMLPTLLIPFVKLHAPYVPE